MCTSRNGFIIKIKRRRWQLIKMSDQLFSSRQKVIIVVLSLKQNFLNLFFIFGSCVLVQIDKAVNNTVGL